MNWLAFSFVTGMFILLMIIFSKENMDYVTYALFFAVLSSLLIAIIYGTTFDELIEFVEFQPIIFIFSMEIMITIAEKYGIFHWIAIKTLHITKGNHRSFFYLICFVSTLMAGIIADITVAIIFIPLVIRACKILDIKPAVYLYGITITINIGSILTTFSSSENIIVSGVFDLDIVWFIKNLFLFCLFLLAITIFIIDRVSLRKITPPTERKKTILLDIMTPDKVIVDKKMFMINSIYLLVVLAGLILVEESYIVAMIGAIVMSLFNKIKITDTIKSIDWKLILFILSLFLLIGAMDVIGIFEIISSQLSEIASGSIMGTAIIFFLIANILSGFISNTPTTIIFIRIILEIYGPKPPAIILMALIAGVHLGGNLLPQGAACDIMTLNIAKKYKLEEFTYNGLLKKGFKYALLHIGIGIIFIVIYTSI